MNMWWLVAVQLLRVTTTGASADLPAVDGRERSEIDPTTISSHNDFGETKEIPVLIVPLDKNEVYNVSNKKTADQEANSGILQSSNHDDQHILLAKVSPLTLKLLHIPQPHLSPKLELLRQRIKLKNLLLKAKLRQRKLLPGLLRSTQTEPTVEPEGSSEEFLMNVLGSSTKDTGKNDLIKNTLLTKTTTYNITNLTNDTKDPEFLVSKKEDFSVNLSLLDKKGRPTNLSEAHSSSLQLFIDTDSDEQEEFEPFIATVTLDNVNDTSNKYQGLDSNKNAMENDKDASLRKHVVTPSNGIRPNEDKKLGSRLNCDSQDFEGAECGFRAPTEFVNGQFTSDSNILDPIVGYPNPMSHQNHEFEIVNGQLIPVNGELSTDYTSYRNGETEPGKDVDWFTEQSISSIVTDQESLTKNISEVTADQDDITSIGNTSNESQFNSEDNETRDKTPGRSDIPVSKSQEETSDELSKDNLYNPISILGQPNENFSDIKKTDEGTDAINVSPNKYRAKSGNTNSFESSQIEVITPHSHSDSSNDSPENVDLNSSSTIETYKDDTILGGTEAPSSSYEESETEVIEIVTDSLEKRLDETLDENNQNGVQLSSENIVEDRTIFMKDHNTGNDVTELDEDNISPKNPTKPTSGNIVEVTSKEVDNVGEPSSLEPSQLNSTLDKTLQDENVSEENSSEDDDLSSHPVELSAGSQQLGDYSNTEGPYTDDEGEYLTELCFPLKNKNLSLLDLLSGHFFIEKNGHKVPLYLQDNPMKNCTSATKKCKLYLNLKKDVKDLGNESETDLTEDNSSEISSMNKKRNVRAMNAIELKNNSPIIIYEVFNRSLGSLSLQPMNENVIPRSEDGNEASHGMQFVPKESSNNNNPIPHFQNAFLTTLTPLQSIPKTDSKQYQPGMATSRSAGQFYDETTLNKNDSGFRNHVLASHDNQKRYPRTVGHVDEDSSSSKSCNCDSPILQSAAPKLSYAHFVQKRLAILTNIVHAVNGWGTDSKEGS